MGNTCNFLYGVTYLKTCQSVHYDSKMTTILEIFYHAIMKF